MNVQYPSRKPLDEWRDKMRMNPASTISDGEHSAIAAARTLIVVGALDALRRAAARCAAMPKSPRDLEASGIGLDRKSPTPTA